MDMDIDNIKPFTEMDSRELFLVLTGEKGVIAQVNLQSIIKEYVMKHSDTADLVTMVQAVAKEE